MTELVEEILELERNKIEKNSKPADVEKPDDNRQALDIEADKDKIESAPKTRFVPVQSNPAETLDIVNCANADFRQTVLSHNVYLCPAQGGAYKHKQCKYLGVYWEKRVGAVAEIEAVVDVHSESKAEIYWVNGKEKIEYYIAEAKEQAFALRPNDLPIRVFLLKNLNPTDFIKDSPGGMFGSKIYLNIEALNVTDAVELAKQLNGEKWSKFNL